MINFKFDKFCYGCSACSNICPQKAIRMEENREGFLVPVIDYKKCINCGMCNNVCIKMDKQDAENVFDNNDGFIVAYRKNTDLYKEYTSSGIFSAIAENFIKNDNFVCGCIWDKDMQAIHILTNEMDFVKKMATSKYVQSNMKNVINEMEEKLREGKKILFSGTPCQVAAVNKTLSKFKNQLYTIGIVCHGTPSPKVWELYKKELEKKVKSKMSNANFRYKSKYGWITPFSMYEFQNGKRLKKLSFTEDPYIVSFGKDILHRNTCYICDFKGTKSNADLIIGDNWGCSNKLLKASKNKGINAIIIHTNKGKQMLETISNDFIYENISKDEIIKENKPIVEPVKYNPLRETFYNKFIKDNNVSHIYMGMNNSKNEIKRILYKLSVFEYLKRLKYYISHK